MRTLALLGLLLLLLCRPEAFAAGGAGCAALMYSTLRPCASTPCICGCSYRWSASGRLRQWPCRSMANCPHRLYRSPATNAPAGDVRPGLHPREGSLSYRMSSQLSQHGRLSSLPECTWSILHSKQRTHGFPALGNRIQQSARCCIQAQKRSEQCFEWCWGLSNPHEPAGSARWTARPASCYLHGLRVSD